MMRCLSSLKVCFSFSFVTLLTHFLQPDQFILYSFIFLVPEEYEEFQEIVQSYGDAQQRTVLERMLKSNHPALNGTNKPKIEKMFAFLMQYIHDVASGENFQPLNDLAPVTFELGQLIPSGTAASTMLDVLLEKREELSSHGRKRPPSMATV